MAHNFLLLIWNQFDLEGPSIIINIFVVILDFSSTVHDQTDQNRRRFSTRWHERGGRHVSTQLHLQLNNNSVTDWTSIFTWNATFNSISSFQAVWHRHRPENMGFHWCWKAGKLCALWKLILRFKLFCFIIAFLLIHSAHSLPRWRNRISWIMTFRQCEGNCIKAWTNLKMTSNSSTATVAHKSKRYNGHQKSSSATWTSKSNWLKHAKNAMKMLTSMEKIQCWCHARSHICCSGSKHRAVAAIGLPK